nr:hypothetical protein [Streptococcus lutetiensis]
MKGIKLVDVDLSEARTEQTGTCELCFGSRWCDNPILIFEKPDGEQFSVEGFGWDWGDYHEARIDNYLNFSDWLSKQDVDWNMLNEDGYEYLADLVYWYREEEVEE